MRRIANTRIAGLATALVAGALAVYALRSTPDSGGSAARAQQPAVEVRTQVIRRTVHVVRHARPPRRGGGPARGGNGAAATTRALTPAGAPRTASSGSHVAGTPNVVAPQTAAPRTRTSGSGGAGAPHTHGGNGGRGAVRTRTSGGSVTDAPSQRSTGAPVRTRTSGGGGDGDGGEGHDHGDQHDD